MAIRISLDLFTLIFKPTLVASLAIFSSTVCNARVEWANKRDLPLSLQKDFWLLLQLLLHFVAHF
jgi:hypothetical protein